MAADRVTLPITSHIEAEVTIYDVGHGNSALIHTEDWTVLVDVPPTRTVFEDLQARGISRIDHLILSHAERDHFGGAMRLLSDPNVDVGRLWVNPDATKAGPTWERLRRTAYQLTRVGQLEAGFPIANTTPDLESGVVRVEFLHPDYEWALAGAGSASTGADTNTLSVVVRVWLGDVAAVTLAADLTQEGLARIEELGADIKARVLVFPHHGGLPGGGDVHAFGRRVAETVEPEVVFFSFGRSVHENPRPEVVAGIHSALPNADVRCTQLSRRCAVADQARPTEHLSSRPAAGREAGTSCLGSLTIRWQDGALSYDPPFSGHDDFVDVHADSALCRAPFV